MNIVFSPIGIIHTPFMEPEGTPIQTVFSKETRGAVEVFDQYRQALTDLDGFSHIILLYYFHQSRGPKLTCRPFLDNQERGLFATRAPARPNAIGLSIVELIKVENCLLTIGCPDMIDGTPLLDIKPYIGDFDVKANIRTGWYATAQNRVQTAADRRFSGS